MVERRPAQRSTAAPARPQGRPQGRPLGRPQPRSGGAPVRGAPPVRANRKLPTSRHPLSWFEQAAEPLLQRYGPAAKALAQRAGREVAARAAGRAGAVFGVSKATVNTVGGLVRGGAFLARLANPLDPLISPRGQSAREQLYKAGKKAGGDAVDYVTSRAARPQRIVDDVNNKVRRLNTDLNPSATPEAASLRDEMRRRFKIGENQGKVVFDVGTFALGGPARKGLVALGTVSKPLTVAEHIARGAPAKAAKYLAEPYAGRGHHFIPLRTRIFGRELPKAFMESRYNVLKPEGVTWAQFHELHSLVDSKFRGARLPDSAGRGWSAKKLGIAPLSPFGRVLYGAPKPLKEVVGGAADGATGSVYALRDRKRRNSNETVAERRVQGRVSR